MKIHLTDPETGQALSLSVDGAQGRAWEPIGAFYKRMGYGPAPAVKCPNYGLCGDYCTMARAGSRPGRVEVRCAYCARKGGAQ